MLLLLLLLFSVHNSNQLELRGVQFDAVVVVLSARGRIHEIASKAQAACLARPQIEYSANWMEMAAVSFPRGTNNKQRDTQWQTSQLRQVQSQKSIYHKHSLTIWERQISWRVLYVCNLQRSAVCNSMSQPILLRGCESSGSLHRLQNSRWILSICCISCK